MCVCTLSSVYEHRLLSITWLVDACVLNHVQLSATSWTVAHQAPLPMEFSRQEYWSRLPFPSPGDLPNSGIEPVAPALANRFFTSVLPGKVISQLF